jgi:hypothetical protein
VSCLALLTLSHLGSHLGSKSSSEPLDALRQCDEGGSLLARIAQVDISLATASVFELLPFSASVLGLQSRLLVSHRQSASSRFCSEDESKVRRESSVLFAFPNLLFCS